jgi:flagellar assembly factor FliW
MKIDTRNFGKIEIEEEKVISFPDGIPGFQDEKRFVIINNPDEENPFQWLQSVDNPNLAFVIINPFFIKPNYDIKLSPSTVEKLRIEDEKHVLVYTIVVVPEDIKKMTVNLAGPIVINGKERIGKQIILDNSEYTTKHYIFNQDQEGEE